MIALAEVGASGRNGAKHVDESLYRFSKNSTKSGSTCCPNSNQNQNQNLYCGLAPQRGEHRGSKVTDVYPGVTGVYRNGLFFIFLVGRRSHTICTTLVLIKGKSKLRFGSPSLELLQAVLWSCAAERVRVTNLKVTDIYPRVTDIYRNGLLHMFLKFKLKIKNKWRVSGRGFGRPRAKQAKCPLTDPVKSP